MKMSQMEILAVLRERDSFVVWHQNEILKEEKKP